MRDLCATYLLAGVLVSHLSALTDNNILRGLVIRLHCPRILDLPHHIQPINHLPKNHMLIIQERSRHRRKKELASIRIGPRVGHGQQSRLVVLEREVLVCEFGRAVDVCGACAVTVEEVAALDHEVFDYAVEFAAFVALGSATGVFGFAGAELAEVFCCSWCYVGEELHLDTSEWLACVMSVMNIVLELYGSLMVLGIMTGI